MVHLGGLIHSYMSVGFFNTGRLYVIVKKLEVHLPILHKFYDCFSYILVFVCEDALTFSCLKKMLCERHIKITRVL